MHGFRRQLWSAGVLWALLCSQAAACLTFCLQHKKSLVYGRNFDWEVGVGVVMVNPRHVRKTGFVLPPEKPLSWVSRYGSISFNQFSREVPVGGMNEKGLVIECLVSGAEYPRRDSDRAINELQWIQYHLDTCETVEEVIRSAKAVRVSPYAVSLHYFVTDASGMSAVIEFLRGKMVHRSAKSLPVKVLANRLYDRALQDRHSQTSRFARAARMVDRYDGKKDSVQYAFETLDAVAQGDFTKWQVVYDIPRRHIHLRTVRNRKTRIVDMATFDFTTATEALSRDVNRGDEGKMSDKHFAKHTATRNDALMRMSLTKLQRSGLMRDITPQHVAHIGNVVASCTYEPPAGDEDATLPARITDQEARRIATDHINASFKGHVWKTAQGNRRFYAVSAALWHSIEVVDDRVTLTYGTNSRGQDFTVSMALDGTDVKVLHSGYALR